MEEQLRKLVEYAEPKPKSFLCVSGNNKKIKLADRRIRTPIAAVKVKHANHYTQGNKSRLKTSFIRPLDVPPSFRYEMALTSLETYYSFPNIDASNNHLKVSLGDGKTWMDIRIPTGCYEI